MGLGANQVLRACAIFVPMLMFWAEIMSFSQFGSDKTAIMINIGVTAIEGMQSPKALLMYFGSQSKEPCHGRNQ